METPTQEWDPLTTHWDQGTGMTDRIRKSLTEGTERRKEVMAQL